MTHDQILELIQSSINDTKVNMSNHQKNIDDSNQRLEHYQKLYNQEKDKYDHFRMIYGSIKCAVAEERAVDVEQQIEKDNAPEPPDERLKDYRDFLATLNKSELDEWNEYGCMPGHICSSIPPDQYRRFTNIRIAHLHSPLLPTPHYRPEHLGDEAAEKASVEDKAEAEFSAENDELARVAELYQNFLDSLNDEQLMTWLESGIMPNAVFGKLSPRDYTAIKDKRDREREVLSSLPDSTEPEKPKAKTFYTSGSRDNMPF